MSLTGTTNELTDGERVREPRSLGVLAYFDGWHQAAYPGGQPTDYPRRLTRREAACWREGWADGYAERRCQATHGFAPCPGGHA